MSRTLCSNLFYGQPGMAPASSGIIYPHLFGPLIPGLGDKVALNPFQADIDMGKEIASASRIPDAAPHALSPGSSSYTYGDGQHPIEIDFNPAAQFDRVVATAETAARDKRFEDAAAGYGSALALLGRPSQIGRLTQTAQFFLGVHSKGDRALRDRITRTVIGYAHYARAVDINDMLTELHTLMPHLMAYRDAAKNRYLKLLARKNELTGESEIHDDKTIAERRELLSIKIRANGVDIRTCDEQLESLFEEQRSLRGFIDPIREKLARVEHEIDRLEGRIKEVSGALGKLKGIKGMKKEGRVQRAMLLSSLEELQGDSAAKSKERTAILNECEPIRVALEASERRIKETYGERVQFFAKRMAIYAENDAYDAKDAGDTDWTKVMGSEVRAQEHFLYRARLAQAAAMMRYAVRAESIMEDIARQRGVEPGKVAVQKAGYFKDAFTIADSVLNDVYHSESDVHNDIALYANLISIEALARQAEAAHRRGDHTELKTLIEKLNERARWVASMESSLVANGLGRVETARYLADVAELLAKMGILDNALSHAYSITKRQGYGIKSGGDDIPDFSDTEAAERLRNAEIFAPYLRDDGLVIKAPGEAAKKNIWLNGIRRFRAALANPHFISLKQRFGYGFGAMALTMGAGFAVTGEVPALSAAGAAVLTNTAVQLVNGWRSPEAKSAGVLGVYDRRVVDSLKDAGGLFGTRLAMGALGWGLAAGGIATVATPENWHHFDTFLTNLGKSWQAVGNKIVDSAIVPALQAGPLAVADPIGSDVLAQTVHAGMHGHLIGASQAALVGAQALARLPLEMPQWVSRIKTYNKYLIPAAALAGTQLGIYDMQDLYHAYMGAAGIIYAGYTFSPKLRTSLQQYAWYFLPAGVMLGGHLGTSIMGEPAGSKTHWQILGCSSMAMAQGALMLMVTGTIPLPTPVRNFFRKRRGEEPLPQEDGAGFWGSLGHGIRHDANHISMLAIAISVGFSAGVGSLIQKDRPDSFALMAFLGAMTTVGILPMTLGLSGVLKRQIPLLDFRRQAREDTEGLDWLTRKKELWLSTGQAFAAPYTQNRTVRSVTADLPWAFIRTIMPGGYKSPLAFVASEAGQTVTGNPASSRTFPEVGGTDWQLDPLTFLLRRPAIDGEKVLDHFKKSAKRMSPWHMWLYSGHTKEALKTMWSPATAIRYIWNPPKFPLQRERHYLAQLYLYVTGQTEANNEITTDMLRNLLKVIQEKAAQPDNVETLAPIIEVLYMARSHHTPVDLEGDGPLTFPEKARVSLNRRIITDWFGDNGWITILYGLNPDTIKPIAPGTRRQQRAAVKKAVNESAEEYSKRAGEYLGRDRPDLTAKLFQ